MSIARDVLERSKAAYQLQSEGHVFRPAFGQRVPRSSISCRHHQACLDHFATQLDSIGEEASTSGQSISNIPLGLESLIQRLPPRSKRRKLLIATTSLSSLVSKWNGDFRSDHHQHHANTIDWASISFSNTESLHTEQVQVHLTLSPGDKSSSKDIKGNAGSMMQGACQIRPCSRQ